MEKVSLLFSVLVFVRAAIYHLLVESGGQMFISRSREVLKMNKLTIYKEFSKNMEAIKTAAEETKKTLRMYINRVQSAVIKDVNVQKITSVTVQNE